MKIEIVNGRLTFTGERNRQEQEFLNFAYRCKDDDVVKMNAETTTDGANVIAMSLAPTPFPTS
jgi:hypothetical protein